MFKRELFTIEHAEMLDAAIRNKHWGALTSLFPISSPAQEYEIARILREHGPVFKKAVPSKVEMDLKKALSENPQLLDNPEVEKEWQDKLDEEKRQLIKEVRGEKEEPTEKEQIIDEPVVEPKKRGRAKKNVDVI